VPSTYLDPKLQIVFAVFMKFKASTH